MNCKVAKRLIAAFVDGELRPDREAALDRHLALCQSCREEVAALKRTIRLMDLCEEIEPSFTLADIRERAAQRRSLPWLLPLPRLATAAMVFAALAVGSISGIYYGSHVSRQTQSPSVVSKQHVSESFGLDAFDDGLASALFIADARTLPAGEVTR